MTGATHRPVPDAPSRCCHCPLEFPDLVTGQVAPIHPELSTEKTCFGSGARTIPLAVPNQGAVDGR